MSQEDILQSTKTVVQGLDALKNEHGKMLTNILDSIRTTSTSSSSSLTDANKLEEKAGLLRKSMDMIELGKLNFEYI
jgi:kinesin light chain